MELKHIAEQAINAQVSGGCYPCMPPINITVEGVQELLDKLNPYKAPAPDNLQPRILRELRCQIPPVVCNIFKVSLRTGTVPDDWKLANVTPIHKKGSRQLPENYRPVSLTSICYELMEHILVSPITKHLDRHGILNDSQHGFRRARSCEAQLIAFIDDLAKEMQGRGQTDVIVMDFSKAFDKAHTMACYTNCQSVALMTLHCSG